MRERLKSRQIWDDEEYKMSYIPRGVSSLWLSHENIFWSFKSSVAISIIYRERRERMREIRWKRVKESFAPSIEPVKIISVSQSILSVWTIST